MSRLLATMGMVLVLSSLGVHLPAYADGGTTCETALCVTHEIYTANGTHALQWFAYRPSTSGTLVVQSCGFTSADTYVYLYSSCSTVLTYNDDECGVQSSLTYPVTAGTQYYIVWTNTYTSATYQWSLSGPEGVCSGLSIDPAALDFGYTGVGHLSAVKSYALTGTALSPASGDVTVTTTAPFEISLSPDFGFALSPLTVPYTGGVIGDTQVYVRFHPLAAGIYAQNLVNSGGGAADADVAVSGTTVYGPCTPQFYDLNIGEIQNVSFGVIDQDRSGYSFPPYYDYSQSVPPAAVVPGQTYPLSVTWYDLDAHAAQTFAYFDWNHNAILDDDGEVYYLGNAFSAGTPHTVTADITVPLTATRGVVTRLRIRVMNGDAGPCAPQYGEAQDYSVVVAGSLSPLMLLLLNR
jgi:hypothetical protein